MRVESASSDTRVSIVRGSVPVIPPPRPSSPEGGIEPLNSRAPSPANSHLASGQTCANVRANGNATYVSAVEGARALRISLKPRTSPGLVG